jgi:hypothetical protein
VLRNQRYEPAVVLPSTSRYSRRLGTSQKALLHVGIKQELIDEQLAAAREIGLRNLAQSTLRRAAAPAAEAT